MVIRIREYLNIDQKLKDLSQSKFKKILKNNLINTYRDHWFSTKSQYENCKLCTYFKLNQHFGFENYLTERKL